MSLQARRISIMNDYDSVKNRTDTAELLNLLKIKYGFDGFYHYTDYSNLGTIFEAQALIARSKIKLNFHDSSDRNVLTQAPRWIHDQVRLFYFPKPPFLYNNEGVKPKEKNAFGNSFNIEAHMPRPVALRFKETVAYIDGIKYCDGSASYLQAPNDDHLTYIEKKAKDAMRFDWCIIASRDTFTRTRYTCGVDVPGPTITNRRNAEILIPNKLSLTYLDQIAFRSEADRKQAVLEFGDSRLYQVRYGVFHNNRTYLLDYDLDWRKGSDHIHIDLILLPRIRLDNYKHIMKLYSTYGLRRLEVLDLRHRDESVDFDDCEDITKIEYYMDDTLCAVWEANRW